MPSAPVPQANKKRKRPTTKDSADEVDEAERMHSVQKNIEKLMKNLGAGVDALEGEDTEQPVKRKREGKAKRGKDVDRGQNLGEERGRKPERKGKTEEIQQIIDNRKHKRGKMGDTVAAADWPQDQSSALPAKSKKRKRKEKRARCADAHSDAGLTHEDAPLLPVATVSVSSKKVGGDKDNHAQDGLTTLQARMKSSLDGARFRWVCSRRRLIFGNNNTLPGGLTRCSTSPTAERHANS